MTTAKKNQNIIRFISPAVISSDVSSYMYVVSAGNEGTGLFGPLGSARRNIIYNLFYNNIMSSMYVYTNYIGK